MSNRIDAHFVAAGKYHDIDLLGWKFSSCWRNMQKFEPRWPVTTVTLTDSTNAIFW